MKKIKLKIGYLLCTICAMIYIGGYSLEAFITRGVDISLIDYLCYILLIIAVIFAIGIEVIYIIKYIKKIKGKETIDFFEKRFLLKFILVFFAFVGYLVVIIPALTVFLSIAIDLKGQLSLIAIGEMAGKDQIILVIEGYTFAFLPIIYVFIKSLKLGYKKLFKDVSINTDDDLPQKKEDDNEIKVSKEINGNKKINKDLFIYSSCSLVLLLIIISYLIVNLVFPRDILLNPFIIVGTNLESYWNLFFYLVVVLLSITVVLFVRNNYLLTYKQGKKSLEKLKKKITFKVLLNLLSMIGLLIYIFIIFIYATNNIQILNGNNATDSQIQAFDIVNNYIKVHFLIVLQVFVYYIVMNAIYIFNLKKIQKQNK